MTPLPPRHVTLVLCTADGTVLGALEPFDVEVPWWQDAEAVVAGAHRAHGVDVTVVRLLDAGRETWAAGGAVTYLAEVARPPSVSLQPWTGELADSPLRQSWARAGGAAQDLEWARGALAARGSTLTGAPQQVRTWNLSSLWRLPTSAGPAWLKVVPGFFAHEGPLLQRLPAGVGPAVLAADEGRTLLAEVPGADLYDATPEQLRAMIALLVDLQHRCAADVGELLALGLPDWRAATLPTLAADTLARAEITGADRSAVEDLLASLPGRFVAVADCGLPDTLVHGDFHPGNVRGDDEHGLRLLDWGDSGVGCPLLDQTAFLDRVPREQVPALRNAWAARWRSLVPGSDPERAARLLRPVAALRQAVVYRRFLDAIEPSERVYHRGDPERWLGTAARLWRDET